MRLKKGDDNDAENNSIRDNYESNLIYNSTRNKLQEDNITVCDMKEAILKRGLD